MVLVMFGQYNTDAGMNGLLLEAIYLNSSN